MCVFSKFNDVHQLKNQLQYNGVDKLCVSGLCLLDQSFVCTNPSFPCAMLSKLPLLGFGSSKTFSVIKGFHSHNCSGSSMYIPGYTRIPFSIPALYNVAAASKAPAALKEPLFVNLTSTGYIHSIYFAQPQYATFLPKYFPI